MATVKRSEFAAVTITLETQDEVDRLHAVTAVFKDAVINSIFEKIDEYANVDDTPMFTAYDSKGKLIDCDALTLKRDE